jgi:hypothetical protein
MHVAKQRPEARVCGSLFQQAVSWKNANTDKLSNLSIFR